MPNSYIRRVRKPDRLRRTRVRVPEWIDPFPWIQGSSIEKMVMAELVRRGIYFEHTPQTNPLVWPPGAQDAWSGQDLKDLEPDFLFPQYKIWLEIQGAYFHTLPGAVERDSLRFVLIEASGWRPIYWWEDDIKTRMIELFDSVPEFYMIDRALNSGGVLRTSPGLTFYEGGDGIDHLVGLRKALSGRARPPQKLVVRRRRKRRPK